MTVSIEDFAVRFGERCAVSFQRTLRVPEDGRTHPLPPGLGAMRLYRLAEHAGRLPRGWAGREGAFLPLYQREALWLGFRSTPWKPTVLVVGVGGINAVSGERFEPRLRADPQNYVVCPPQPWLDGIHAGRAHVRQFVAAPLGSGYTVQAALKGEEERGGIQFAAFDPRAGARRRRPHRAAGGRPRLVPPVQPLRLGLHRADPDDGVQLRPDRDALRRARRRRPHGDALPEPPRGRRGAVAEPRGRSAAGPRSSGSRGARRPSHGPGGASTGLFWSASTSTPIRRCAWRGASTTRT